MLKLLITLTLLLPSFLFSLSKIAYDFEFLGTPCGSETIEFLKDGDEEIVIGKTDLDLKFKGNELKLSYLSTGVFKGNDFEKYEVSISGIGTPIRLEASKCKDGYRIIFRAGEIYKESKIETSDSFMILDNNIVWPWIRILKYFAEPSEKKRVKVILPQLFGKMEKPILDLILLEVERFQDGFTDFLFDLQGNQIMIRMDDKGIYEIYQGPIKVNRR